MVRVHQVSILYPFYFHKLKNLFARFKKGIVHIAVQKPNQSVAEEQSRLLSSKGEILLLQSENGVARIEVLMHGETVWLILNEMAQLFQIHKSGILKIYSKHLSYKQMQ